MERSNFDQLLQRYLTGRVTPEEKTRIEAWLDEIKTEDNSDLNLSKEQEEEIFQRIKSKHNFRSSHIYKENNTFRILKVAASLAILVLLSYTGWHLFDKAEPDQNILSKNGVDRVILNDGTIVWLRDKSDISYYEKQEGNTTYRYSTLQGEGLFEVAKDPSRPFIINCDEVKIKVVGTSFNLKSLNNELELSVLTGKVQLWTKTDSVLLDVLPDETAIYKGSGQFEKASLNKAEKIALVEDTQYDLSFADVPMAALIERLEQKFGIKITTENPMIKACKISIDLTDQSLKSSLQFITEVLHVGVVVDGKNVTLIGSGCD